MSKLPVYLIGRFPEIKDSRSTEWTTVCRTGNFIMIEHQEYRDTSRWKFETRKRPYLVKIWYRKGVYTSDLSSHRTLEAAEKAAAKYAIEFAK